MLAYILMTLREAKEREVRDSLRELKEVQESNILFGEWDIIAKVEVDNPDALGTFVMEHIRTIPGVNVTSTLIVAK